MKKFLSLFFAAAMLASGFLSCTKEEDNGIVNDYMSPVVGDYDVILTEGTGEAAVTSRSAMTLGIVNMHTTKLGIARIATPGGNLQLVVPRVELGAVTDKDDPYFGQTSLTFDGNVDLSRNISENSTTRAEEVHPELADVHVKIDGIINPANKMIQRLTLTLALPASYGGTRTFEIRDRMESNDDLSELIAGNYEIYTYVPHPRSGSLIHEEELRITNTAKNTIEISSAYINASSERIPFTITGITTTGNANEVRFSYEGTASTGEPGAQSDAEIILDGYVANMEQLYMTLTVEPGDGEQAYIYSWYEPNVYYPLVDIEGDYNVNTRISLGGELSALARGTVTIDGHDDVLDFTYSYQVGQGSRSVEFINFELSDVPFTATAPTEDVIFELENASVNLDLDMDGTVTPHSGKVTGRIAPGKQLYLTFEREGDAPIEIVMENYTAPSSADDIVNLLTVGAQSASLQVNIRLFRNDVQIVGYDKYPPAPGAPADGYDSSNEISTSLDITRVDGKCLKMALEYTPLGTALGHFDFTTDLVELERVDERNIEIDFASGVYFTYGNAGAVANIYGSFDIVEFGELWIVSDMILNLFCGNYRLELRLKNPIMSSANQPE